MLPRLEYFGDPADDEDEETRRLREGQLVVEDADDDPLIDTRLMPAKHGAKSPTLASHGPLEVPSPYPSASKQHASGVQKKVTPRPPPPERVDPPELPALFAELYSSVEPTGSDVHAPIHRLDGASALPSPHVLAARRSPWVIQVTPPEFQPLPMPAPPTRAAETDLVARGEKAVAPARVAKNKSQSSSAILGGLLGVLCGALIASIANGTITQRDARAGVTRVVHAAGALFAHP